MITDYDHIPSNVVGPGIGEVPRRSPLEALRKIAVSGFADGWIKCEDVQREIDEFRGHRDEGEVTDDLATPNTLPFN